MGGASLLMRLKNCAKLYCEQKIASAFWKGTSAIQISSTVIRVQREDQVCIMLLDLSNFYFTFYDIETDYNISVYSNWTLKSTRMREVATLGTVF
jgi:hypothetical protein